MHVEFSNVTKVYSEPPQTVTALNNISFQIHEGEFVCIVGPSGCGKSTLLRMIAGLDRPSSGEIRFKGDLLTAPHPKISMVFQTFALLPWRIDPEVVLMDEAFSAIDEFTAEALREEVAEIHAETQKTFLLVTHNLPEAIELADRILVLSARPARVKSIVPIELLRPRSPTASDFVSIHKDIFSLLQSELEASIMRHRLSGLKEFQGLRDMEDR